MKIKKFHQITQATALTIIDIDFQVSGALASQVGHNFVITFVRRGRG
ncbi:MAG TPA: hypothetical protein VIY68_20265 [Steroidobacteraceae bacterium]